MDQEYEIRVIDAFHSEITGLRASISGTTVSLLERHLSGIAGKGIVHFGPGIGHEMVAALAAGADRAIGVDHDRAAIHSAEIFWRQPLGELKSFLNKSLFLRELYGDAAVDVLCDRTNTLRQQLPPGKMQTLDFKLLGVLSSDLTAELLSENDAVVANRMYNHMDSTHDAGLLLEQAASVLKPGGVAIFGLEDRAFYLKSAQDDQREKQDGVFGTLLYQAAEANLIDALNEEHLLRTAVKYLHFKERAKKETMDYFSMTTPMSSSYHPRWQELEEGCPSLSFDESYQVAIPLNRDLPSVVMGYLVFAAGCLAKDLSIDVIRLVNKSVTAAVASVGEAGILTPAILRMSFFVFRKEERRRCESKSS